MDLLTPESFEPHVGTGFAVNVDGHEDVLTLTEVKARKPMPGFDRVPFTLSFKGASTNVAINSATLLMRHAEMGELAIHVSPTGRNPDGTVRYDAIFG